MAQAYAQAAQTAGHEVIVRDLYAMGFDPSLRSQELVGSADFEPQSDVLAEIKLIDNADVFALFYPLWFNAPPAILKGYIDRVFGTGFGFRPSPNGSEPLLMGRKLFSVTSSGAPRDWVESTGAMDALRKLFDNHVAAVCGLTVIDHIHFGRITPGIRNDFVQGCAERVKAAVKAMTAI